MVNKYGKLLMLVVGRKFKFIFIKIYLVGELKQSRLIRLSVDKVLEELEFLEIIDRYVN